MCWKAEWRNSKDLASLMSTQSIGKGLESPLKISSCGQIYPSCQDLINLIIVLFDNLEW